MQKRKPYETVTRICISCNMEMQCSSAGKKKYCDNCIVARRREKDKIVQKAKREKPEFKEKYRAYSIKRNYGITMDEFNSLWALQGGLCAICKTDNSENKRQWAVDHCHKTNQVRGILCNKCNMMIGLGMDNMLIFHRAISYIGRAGYIIPFSEMKYGDKAEALKIEVDRQIGLAA